MKQTAREIERERLSDGYVKAVRQNKTEAEKGSEEGKI